MPASSSARPTPGFILLIGALTAFGAVSLDLYLPALAAIAADFDASIGDAQLTMSTFLAGMAIGQLGFGPLSDRMGRRPPLLAGILLYTLASAALLFAPTIELLSAGRFVQGLGACAGVVIARAIVRDRFDTTETARLFSLTFLVLAIAPMVAPSLGALMMAWFGWPSIFLLFAAFGLIVGAAVLFGLPESRTAETAASAAGESALGSYAAALRHPTVRGLVLAGALNGAALFAYIVASPALFIEYFGKGPTDFALIFAFNMLGLIVTSQLNRYLLPRFGPAVLARRGTLVALLFSGLLVLLVVAGLATLPLTILLLFCAIGSYGFVAANASAMALGPMPERSGAISALLGAVSFAFGALVGVLTAPFAADGPLAVALAMGVGFAGSAWAIHHATRTVVAA